MVEIIVKDITWKKGETGKQNFEIYDSDSQSRRNGTGKTYKLRIWSDITGELISEGNLTATDQATGKYYYEVQSTDTNEVADYLGEVLEIDTFGQILKSNTFAVKILATAPDP